MGNQLEKHQPPKEDPEPVREDPNKEIKEKIKQTDDWVVVNSSNSLTSNETFSAHRPIETHIFMSCRFCNVSLITFSRLQEHFRTIESRICPKCQFIFKSETHYVLKEERNKKLKEVFENKTPEMKLLMEYSQSGQTRYLYCRYIEDLDTKSSNRPNSTSSDSKCDICGSYKEYYKREGKHFDFSEYWYCKVCKLETIERYNDVNLENEFKEEQRKLMEIFDNKITTQTQYSSSVACRDYFDDYAWYDDKFEVPKEAKSTKRACRICEGDLIKYDEKSPGRPYMVETCDTFCYCSTCKMHFLFTYSHEYN